MKKYPHGLTLNAVCAAIEDYQRHEDSLPEEGILAAFNTLLGHSDIADELRIKQNHIRLRDTYIEELEQRAEAAEAKLAELEKQEPRHFYREHNSYNGMKTDWTEVSAEQLEHLKEIIDPETAEIIELFTRPAPAASLTAQPVKLPKSERLDGNGYGYYFDMNDVFTALEEAGIKFEVQPS